jgi:hypothetical protein
MTRWMRPSRSVRTISGTWPFSRRPESPAPAGVDGPYRTSEARFFYLAARDRGVRHGHAIEAELARAGRQALVHAHARLLLEHLGEPPPRLGLRRVVVGEGVTHPQYRMG